MARPRSEAARSKMLSAALEVVHEVGVHGFTIEEVAKRSGVAKTTIYRHFPTKNVLMIQALDGTMAIPPTPDTGALRTDLLAFLQSVLPTFADSRTRAVLLDMMSAANRDPELRSQQGAMLQSRSGPTRAIFERGRERGEISPHIDYVTALEVIEAPLTIRALMRPRTLDNIDLEPIVDRIVLVLQAGI